ncbi:hypothetical protein BDN72DRAFT_115715 [Pluteus cervinus]|uniref:Uncharacterized protein n=1 Tax=Pluteus cervinus TaxID=181527 RepID=A0ACD3AMD4_9AGAR|nr:hypothetical protein BDN72DRAFT_115715 [Pluteus cervinus]
MSRIAHRSALFEANPHFSSSPDALNLANLKAEHHASRLIIFVHSALTLVPLIATTGSLLGGMAGRYLHGSDQATISSTTPTSAIPECITTTSTISVESPQTLQYVLSAIVTIAVFSFTVAIIIKRGRLRQSIEVEVQQRGSSIYAVVPEPKLEESSKEKGRSRFIGRLPESPPLPPSQPPTPPSPSPPNQPTPPTPPQSSEDDTNDNSDERDEEPSFPPPSGPPPPPPPDDDGNDDDPDSNHHNNRPFVPGGLMLACLFFVIIVQIVAFIAMRRQESISSVVVQGIREFVPALMRVDWVKAFNEGKESVLTEGWGALVKECYERRREELKNLGTRIRTNSTHSSNSLGLSTISTTTVQNQGQVQFTETQSSYATQHIPSFAGITINSSPAVTVLPSQVNTNMPRTVNVIKSSTVSASAEVVSESSSSSSSTSAPIASITPFIAGSVIVVGLGAPEVWEAPMRTAALIMIAVFFALAYSVGRYLESSSSVPVPIGMPGSFEGGFVGEDSDSERSREDGGDEAGEELRSVVSSSLITSFTTAPEMFEESGIGRIVSGDGDDEATVIAPANKNSRSCHLDCGKSSRSDKKSLNRLQFEEIRGVNAPVLVYSCVPQDVGDVKKVLRPIGNGNRSKYSRLQDHNEIDKVHQDDVDPSRATTSSQAPKSRWSQDHELFEPAKVSTPRHVREERAMKDAKRKGKAPVRTAVVDDTPRVQTNQLRKRDIARDIFTFKTDRMENAKSSSPEASSSEPKARLRDLRRTSDNFENKGAPKADPFQDRFGFARSPISDDRHTQFDWVREDTNESRNVQGLLPSPSLKSCSSSSSESDFFKNFKPTKTSTPPPRPKGWKRGVEPRSLKEAILEGVDVNMLDEGSQEWIFEPACGTVPVRRETVVTRQDTVTTSTSSDGPTESVSSCGVTTLIRDVRSQSVPSSQVPDQEDEDRYDFNPPGMSTPMFHQGITIRGTPHPKRCKPNSTLDSAPVRLGVLGYWTEWERDEGDEHDSPRNRDRQPAVPIQHPDDGPTNTGSSPEITPSTNELDSQSTPSARIVNQARKPKRAATPAPHRRTGLRSRSVEFTSIVGLTPIRRNLFGSSASWERDEGEGDQSVRKDVEGEGSGHRSETGEKSDEEEVEMPRGAPSVGMSKVFSVSIGDDLKSPGTQVRFKASPTIIPLPPKVESSSPSPEPVQIPGYRSPPKPLYTPCPLRPYPVQTLATAIGIRTGTVAGPRKAKPQRLWTSQDVKVREQKGKLLKRVADVFDISLPLAPQEEEPVDTVEEPKDEVDSVQDVGRGGRQLDASKMFETEEQAKSTPSIIPPFKKASSRKESPASKAKMNRSSPLPPDPTPRPPTHGPIEASGTSGSTDLKSSTDIKPRTLWDRSKLASLRAQLAKMRAESKSQKSGPLFRKVGKIFDRSVLPSVTEHQEKVVGDEKVQDIQEEKVDGSQKRTRVYRGLKERLARTFGRRSVPSDWLSIRVDRDKSIRPVVISLPVDQTLDAKSGSMLTSTRRRTGLSRESSTPEWDFSDQD